MKVTITEFRANLFKLVERVIAGETVEFDHQGITIRLIVSGGRSTKLDRLTPRQITNLDMSEEHHRAAQQKLHAEIRAELGRDWADL
jgi:antitoxin (DNA-binding transcriptional repressor) of toxin-antitoxin stability system